MTKHAILSASGSHRWLECTPSALLEKEEPESESPYAKEGTLAHAFAENELRKIFNFIDEDEYKIEHEKLVSDELYTDDMKDHVQKYVDEVTKKYNFIEKCGGTKPYIDIETKLNFGECVPDGFGTADAIIYDDTKKLMYIYDLKYGKGVEVSAIKNTQLLLYAVGAVKIVDMIGDVENISLNIIQPRIDNFSSYELTKTELNKFTKNVKEKAKLAIKGEGDFNPSEKTCKFCKVKGKCRARSDKLMKLYFEKESDKDRALIKDDELAYYYEKGKELTSWYADIVNEMHHRMMNGTKIKGYKLAKGRKTRAFTDIEKAIDLFDKLGFKRQLFYENKPIALTKIEKLVGADTFKQANDFITYRESEPTIVEETSNKEEYIPLKEAFSEE